jgi:uncharacterized protein YjbK
MTKISLKIKDLVTKEQYKQLKNDYKLRVKNNEISFFDFCTKTYKLEKITNEKDNNK